MFTIKNITLKNFMSVGQNAQAVNVATNTLTLVLGENVDLGGEDAGSRNGVGKTVILNALSYAFYGEALTKIKKENLINKSNSKHMLVSVNFEVNGASYRIERGRKPNVFKFFVNEEEQTAADESQGDSRETQQAVDRLLGMSHDMFRHVVALNTYSEPFLNLKANDQRLIIEQLLGITQLSEKADRLREQMKNTKDLITQEEQRIRAVQSANSRVQDQIESLQRRQKMWINKHEQDLAQLQQSVLALSTIDIDREIDLHDQWDKHRKFKQFCDHQDQMLKQKTNEIERAQKQLDRLTQEMEKLKLNVCYTCGQPVQNLQEQLANKNTAIAETTQQVNALLTEIEQLIADMDGCETLQTPTKTFYNQLSEAVAHRSNLEHLQAQLATKQTEVDPYAEQIVEMQEQGLEEISWDLMNQLKKIQEHEEFLLKLLTNKDSFIRKKIIDQNLAYLNSRLSYYLFKMGLPHKVVFQSDLSVSITELGRDLDVGNLSRGESNRVILCLSWSFRDVWESLYHPVNLVFIDELLDNGLDTAGVENAMNILKHMVRERNRSVWLISHREELANRVSTVLKVVKENGFSQFLQDQV
jgi:DNA repair exonuclease SbcCD ATPase subunit